jgi:hypothetical protein
VTPLMCGKCSQEFRYNIQLMKHLKSCSEFGSVGGHFICDVCQKVFQSALSLQKHQMKIHKTSIFFCSECQETFASSNEAKLHRRTAQHKTLATRKKLLKNPQLKLQLRKVCRVCKEETANVEELRDHMLAAHPEHKFR